MTNWLVCVLAVNSWLAKKMKWINDLKQSIWNHFLKIFHLVFTLLLCFSLRTIKIILLCPRGTPQSGGEAYTLLRVYYNGEGPHQVKYLLQKYLPIENRSYNNNWCLYNTRQFINFTYIYVSLPWEVGKGIYNYHP